MALFDFLNSNSDSIAAEIQRERQHAETATAAAKQAEDAVQSERDNAILAGDEKTVDKIDAKLAERTGELRRKADIHNKRVQLLEGKLSEAREREESQRLDTAAARAQKALKLAEEITRKEYAKQAAALALTLQKLQALDEFITAQNRVLEAGERENVSNVTHFRHIQSTYEKVRRSGRVEIRNQRHPNNAAYLASHITGYNGKGDGETVVLGDGTQHPRWANVEWEEEVFVAGTWAQPLWEDIKILPPVTVNDPPFHRGEYVSDRAAEESAVARAKILAELGV